MKRKIIYSELARIRVSLTKKKENHQTEFFLISSLYQHIARCKKQSNLYVAEGNANHMTHGMGDIYQLYVLDMITCS